MNSIGENYMDEKVELSKKIVLIGNPGVGKTSMIRKFVHDIFDDKYISTLGTKVSNKTVEIVHPHTNIKMSLNLLIWDVMGEKEYELFHQIAYRGAQGAFIVSDLTRKETLDILPNWVSGLFKSAGEIPIVFIGNKNDLIDQKQFEIEDLAKIASTFNSPSFFTSAKTGENVEKAFKILSENIMKN
jgi:small GTP-binding protein